MGQNSAAKTVSKFQPEKSLLTRGLVSFDVVITFDPSHCQIPLAIDRLNLGVSTVFSAPRNLSVSYKGRDIIGTEVIEDFCDLPTA